ncbi:MAG: DUF493 domain-containing protein [Gemmataceae bacterium]|nr:DUF493 domain-containing protein [Gemmataceae bacterium]
MNDMPSIELLNQTHQFPGRYLFKAIGSEADGFVARVVAAVRDELGLESDPPFSVRHTAGGRHAAVTLEPIVQCAEQVVAVYQRIRALAGLVMLF